jgi:acetolactate synthase-1/2/3 large subunit
MKTLGIYLLEALERYGITHVFGIPGVHNIELYRGLPASGVRHVGARHEQGLGFMADGFARAAGRPAVCFTITGPGLTNIATAMAQAYADSIPMLVIASQNRRGEAGSGRGFLHEMPNQAALAAQVSGFSHSLSTVDELPEVLARAFAQLTAGRPRPAYIEIARDLLSADASALPYPTQIAPLRMGAAPMQSLHHAAQRLGAARAPLILAGGGAARAAGAVRRLAERLQAPVIMTINGRGILPPGHPLAVPFSPSLAPVRAGIAQADVVLAIGTELGPTDYDMYSLSDFPPPAQLIRIEIDAQQMVRNAVPSVALLGDARETVDALLALDLGPPRAKNAVGEAVCASAAASLSTAVRDQIAFLESLRDALPGVLLVGDSTQPVYAGNLGFAAAEPGTWFNSSSGFGTLGYALPAGIGASLAQPQRPVLVLAGDGGLQFTLPELGVLRDLKRWVGVIVWNNDGYGEIKSSMIEAGVAPTAVDLKPPDLRLLAQAYGLEYRLVRDGNTLQGVLAQFATERKPLIIEIDAASFA